MWIKICGIRDTATAHRIAELGADAIGLNFYAPSPRSVSPATALEISRSIAGSILPVGLFVNHSVDQIRSICRSCELTTIQLHGDEPPEFLTQLNEFKIIRAFRIGQGGLAPVTEYLNQCDTLGSRPWACLIDAAVPGHFGGSGATVDWNTLAEDYLRHEWPQLVLAGGLTSANISQAIDVVHPWGVDVASGVESSRGVKDINLIEAFISTARRGLKSADSNSGSCKPV